jgi:hypothetical protein
MLNEPLPADLIGLVTPQHVRGYALAKGWQRVPGVNGNIALFNHPGAKWDQLIVPMDTRFDDYAKRIAEVIENLAAFEQRGATEILSDLLLPDSDVLRYRVVSAAASKGTLPLLEGIGLLEGAKRSLQAAACSVVNPVAYHPRMSRTEAQQLLSACHLGQTERRSFAVTIACPLRAVEQDQSVLGVDPFTRKATTLLMRSLNRLVSAVEADNVTQVYEQTGEPALSANLCDALLKMQPPEERSTLEVSVSWASTLPVQTQAAPTAVRIKYEYFPIIEDVYKKLRPAQEPRASLFVGYVDALNGDPGEDGRVQGETTLLVMHEEEMVKARADLNPDDYQKAVDAHRTVGVVKFRGVLHLGRRIHRITNLTDFSVVQS